MRAYFLLILILATSCIEDGYNRRNVRFEEHAGREDAKHIKPSESMQAGVSKRYSEHQFLGHNVDHGDRIYSDGSPDRYLDRYSRNRTDDYSQGYSKSNYMDDYEGHFKVGNPYEISGVAYHPQNYEEFEEVGIASWYGDDFDGRLTANGETYDLNEMTAAHPTLPLPSIVRVTNLRNGRSVVVRVNDRGPFAKERIMDVSERAAEELGFRDKGTTKVYIQLLRDDTDLMLQKLQIKN